MFLHTRTTLPQNHNRTLRIGAFLVSATLTAGLITGFAGTRTPYTIADDASTQRVQRDRSAADNPHATHARAVLLQDGARFTTVIAYDETVADLLRRLHITLGADDRISAPRESALQNGQRLVLERALIFHRAESVPVPFASVRQADANRYVGDEAVVQAGVPGAESHTYRVVTVGGETTRTPLRILPVVAPTDEVTVYGTKPRPAPRTSLSVSRSTITGVTEHDTGGGVITTSSDTLPYSRALTVRASAYTTERQAWKRTATGTTARVGAIAVDPKVIPYGTRMYIQTPDGSIVYGLATAEDCGGSIKGNRIDLFFDTYEACVQFGIRTCTVYLLD